MKFSASILLLIGTLSSAGAYSVKPQNTVGRREMFQQAGVLAFIAAANPANALDACPKGSNNCLTTKWAPPSGTDASAAASTLKKVIESYPQEGQNKADMGGWTVVQDSFAPGGVVAVEYKSGIGNFARFFNGGNPFVDDLKLAIGEDGVVDVRSSSRVGDSDLGINQKRLAYIADMLQKEGWNAPVPKY
eukprot:jgi/Psemu1/312267/fgenesh1_kg.908_\